MAQSATPVQLKDATLAAFRDYAASAEAAMEPSLRGDAPFLWSVADPKRIQQLGRGQVLGQLWEGNGPAKVPDGLIHDWVGSAFVSGATVTDCLRLVQDYDNHKLIYAPDVLDSRLISRSGDDFQAYLRLRKKKILEVVLDTWHDVHYESTDASHWWCRSYTTQVCEVERPGTAGERILPADTGYGFLWRLYSYWKFQELESVTVVECRAISLTRDVPFALRLVINPIVRSLPRESLIRTLEATRQALVSRAA